MKHIKIISNDVVVYWDNIDSCIVCPCYSPDKDDVFWGICNLSEHYKYNKELYSACPLGDVV